MRHTAESGSHPNSHLDGHVPNQDDADLVAHCFLFFSLKLREARDLFPRGSQISEFLHQMGQKGRFWDWLLIGAIGCLPGSDGYALSVQGGFANALSVFWCPSRHARACCCPCLTSRPMLVRASAPPGWHHGCRAAPPTRHSR